MSDSIHSKCFGCPNIDRAKENDFNCGKCVVSLVADNKSLAMTIAHILLGAQRETGMV